MKKNSCQTRTMALVALLCFSVMSCQRVGETEVWNYNRLVLAPSEGKSESSFYVFVQMGHDAKGCSGCVISNGHMVHVDCQGFGDKCAKSSRVALQEVEGGYTMTTLDTCGLTSEDFFNMPARSLQCSEDAEYAYLNIPAQLVWRDENTLQFTFTGLSFSDEPLYEND